MSKLYIIGSGDSGLGLDSYPFEKDAELWAVNNLFAFHPTIPWTRVFEVHNFQKKNPDTWLRKGAESFRGITTNDYIKQLNTSGLPIYVLDHPECPFTNSRIIPIDTLLKKYRNFFSTTISYELALALEEGFQDICLVGIDMILTAEYRDQRPSVTYFVGLAEGRGVRVTLSQGSPLVENDYLYGKSISKFTLWHRRLEALRSYMASESQKHHNMLEQYKGAANCLDNVAEFYTTLVSNKEKV